MPYTIYQKISDWNSLNTETRNKFYSQILTASQSIRCAYQPDSSAEKSEKTIETIALTGTYPKSNAHTNDFLLLDGIDRVVFCVPTDNTINRTVIFQANSMVN